MKLNGSEIIVEWLKEQGVDTIFGYPGGAILNVYDALYKHSDEITHILTSHEQGASHAADGYARATGKVGVCFATSGPGATNLVTGIATAYMDSVPMVAITCNVTVPLLGRDSFQEIDIAAVPSNLAANIYNKTQGKVQVVAVNTLGVLNLVERGNTVNSISDLKGKTIYATGMGAVPEYTIRYILSGNGLDADKDVNIAWCSDTTEALSKLKSEDGAIAVLPQPFVTAASAQISGLRVVMDLNEAWEKINNNSKIVTGVIVVRKEFAEKYPEQLKKFIDEYNESVAYTSSNIDETAQLIAEYGIVASEAIAKKALPKCHIVCYINNNMRSALEGFLQVLYDQNPKSVGGSMPKDDFYYEY